MGAVFCGVRLSALFFEALLRIFERLLVIVVARSAWPQRRPDSDTFGVFRPLWIMPGTATSACYRYFHHLKLWDKHFLSMARVPAGSDHVGSSGT